MAVTADKRTGSDTGSAIRFASHAGVASIAFGIAGFVVIAIPATLFAWILGTSIAMMRTGRVGLAR